MPIAVNRFGLGARPDEVPPADPKRWLLDQMAGFEPRPAALASVPTSAAMATQYHEFLLAIRDRLGTKGLPQLAGIPPLAGRPSMPAMMADATMAPTMTAAAVADVKTKTPQQEIRGELRQGYRASYIALAEGRVAAAIASPTPFPERLTHFWANHFAVSADKLATIGLAGTLEFEAIRPHLFGTFADLLLAVERHPAMLLYLDQAQSIGPDSTIGRRATNRPNAPRKVGLNENLAREIMELHTLGVGSGYTQADVQELARALTGWSVGGFVRRGVGLEAPDGAFVFQADWHEPGERTLLGTRYPDTGTQQAATMLRALAVHPATAHHLATKLVRHFVADESPPALVARIAAVHVATGGNLVAVYRALIDAPEAWSTPLAKFKTPWDWQVSVLRGIGRADGRCAERRRADPARAADLAPWIARRVGRYRPELGCSRRPPPPRRGRAAHRRCRPDHRRPRARPEADARHVVAGDRRCGRQGRFARAGTRDAARRARVLAAVTTLSCLFGAIR